MTTSAAGEILSAPIPVFAISLSSETRRKSELLELFSGNPAFQLHIVDAVSGRSLPRSVLRYLCKNEQWPDNPGTIGCFLSHVKAWEAVAKCGARFGLVCEDDIAIRDFAYFEGFVPPEDADLIFVNDRMSLGGARAPEPARCMPLLQSLFKLAGTRGAPPGGDAYLLRPEAAHRLCAACLEDSYFGHVDWRLLRYAVTSELLDQLPEDSWVKNVLLNHHLTHPRPRMGIVKGYATGRPFTFHKGQDSVRETLDALKS